MDGFAAVVPEPLLTRLQCLPERGFIEPAGAVRTSLRDISQADEVRLERCNLREQRIDLVDGFAHAIDRELDVIDRLGAARADARTHHREARRQLVRARA